MRSLDELATAMEAAGWQTCGPDETQFCIMTGNNVVWDEWRITPPDEENDIIGVELDGRRSLDLPPKIADAISLIHRWQGQAAPDAAMVERGAEIICTLYSAERSWSEISEAVRESYRKEARLVLAAALGTEDGDGQ